jgi:HEAT repeat protein
MAVTNEQVRAILDLDEPDYDAAAQLGPEALPILQRFVEGPNANRAAKAAYLAGRIGDPAAAPILEFAATSPEASVRAAAASGAQHIGEAAESVLITLVDDDNPAVRKTALNAVPAQPGQELRSKLTVLRDVEPEPMVRDLAARILGEAPGGAAPGGAPPGGAPPG